MEWGVMGLRFVSIFLICFLLLEPMFKWVTQRKEKPIISIAIDNSESMVQNADSAYVRKQLKDDITALSKKLEDKFRIETYTFGQKTEANNELTFSEKLSNISDALESINNQNYNLNHAATLLISDGIYNQGSNPIYALPKGAAPVYSLGLGDTTQRRDALIAQVRHNTTAFVGNDFELNIDCKAYYCANENLNLTVSEGSEVLFSGKMPVQNNSFFGSQKVVIRGAKEGIHTYKIAIAPLTKEANNANNSRYIQVNVLRSKQKLVLLYLAPHPDVASIIRSLENNPNYELKAYELAEYKDENLNDASMFILHQIPGLRGEGNKMLQRLQTANMPLFIITGKQSGLTYLGNAGALRINGIAQNFNEAQASVNQNFPLFDIGEELTQSVQKFAPLISPYGTYQVPADAHVLFYQQIGYVKTTSPLLFFCNNKGSNQTYLCGEGFWRWRLQDFVLNQNQNQTQALMGKIIQWTSGKTDRSKFRVNPGKKFYDENEAIRFEAELFNDLYELMNKPDISLNLKNAEKKTYTYQFSKTDKSYSIDLGNLPAGEYTYEATVNGMQSYGTKTGTLHVKALQTEALQTCANHGVLRATASETGGNFYLRTQLDQLEKDLLENQNMQTVVYEQEEMKDLLDQKWLFFLILALLTLEWLVRKWNGFI